MDPLNLIMIFWVFAVWSYVLYKENLIYAFAEKTFIAVSAGHVLMTGLTSLWKQDLARIVSGEILLIIPTILGLFYLLRLNTQYQWLSRYSTGIFIGVTLGMAVRVLPYRIEGYLISSMVDLTQINNIILIIGTLTTIFYYYFMRKPGVIPDTVAKIGRFFIMINIGTSAAGTLLTRQAYLSERINFLLTALGLI
jgi:hypothetical protein